MNTVVNAVMKTALRGLATILPVGLTVYILYWIGKTAEDLIGGLLKYWFGDAIYAGSGVLLGFALILAIGLLTRAWLVQRVIRFGERLIGKMPLVKTIYGPLRDMMGFLATGSEDKQLGQVVMVRMAPLQVEMLGFVTRESAEGLTGDGTDAGKVGVYLPMSYQIGGFLVMVPREQVRPLAMSGEQGLRLALTAGVTADRD